MYDTSSRFKDPSVSQGKITFLTRIAYTPGPGTLSPNYKSIGSAKGPSPNKIPSSGTIKYHLPLKGVLPPKQKRANNTTSISHFNKLEKRLSSTQRSKNRT